MAVYKVPQDVEADDKLIGPFSFRQFVYLIVVALSIAAAWGLFQLFPPLAIIPLPIIVFFGVLALPLRKDQPMEIFMAAMVSFYLKPRRRIWDPDGIDSLIEITVPKTVEVQRVKDISQNEAHRRFSYLAEIVDSQGWAVRGVGVQAPNSAMNSDVYFEAQQTQDILDGNNSIAQSLDHKLDQTDARRHQEVMDRVRQQASAAAQPASATTPGVFNYFGGSADSTTPPSAPAVQTPEPSVIKPPVYDPYPTNIQQTVIQPLTSPAVPPIPQAPPEPPVTTSEKVLSAGIMNLATNADLSIETIAREANRIQEKQDLDEEVVISLR
ncbi:MAG TPA: PrgI family protein [Candidatus Saccharimonadales bacterium]|nr:PrgI family protein [Candidatus Saccharimonadales bacterium]